MRDVRELVMASRTSCRKLMKEVTAERPSREARVTLRIKPIVLKKFGIKRDHGNSELKSRTFGDGDSVRCQEDVSPVVVSLRECSRIVIILKS